MAAPTPYQPPLTLPTIQHIALSSKSYRVFGLADEAWQIARDDLKKRLGGGSGGEEEEEMMEICEAVCTALEEDAGGFGTAGFHLEKVQNVQLSTTNSAMFTGTLYPYDFTTTANDDNNLNNNDNEQQHHASSLTPSRLNQSHPHTKNKPPPGNDEFYSTLFENSRNYSNDNDEDGGRFKLRIVISKANEGVTAKKFHDGLFDLSKELLVNSNNNSDCDGEGITEEMVQGNESLERLRQLVLDARIANLEAATGNNASTTNTNSNRGSSFSNEEGGEQPPILGYQVTIMLCEPHIQNEDIVIPPPSYLDKCDANFKPVPYPNDDDDAIIYNGGGHKGRGGVFSGNVCNSLQFVKPGPWEKANLDAFELIALDLKKAFVRVEFPMFPEGCREKTFREVYQLNARLQSGSFATVCRGTHRETGKKVAIKCVLRQDLPPNDDAAIYDEVLILSTLRHCYICPLLDFFEEVECYYLVMELMSGGDLFERIGKRKTYTENDARNLCRKMLESVRYCHENSVAHCDMKPKNLLLSDDDDDVNVKLSDFGFATRVYEPRSLTKQCGTPFFVSPEVLMRSPYDQQSDMWSVGVIMYLLLGGDLPFTGRTQKELFRSIVLGNFDFPEESWSHVSDEAKNLVKELLVTDPAKRLTSRAAMQSPWMRQRGNLLARNNLQYTSRRLKTFNARMKLRSSMIAVTLITSARLSVSKKFASDRSLDSGSQRNVESAPKKLPSFLDIPEENDDS